MDFLFSSVYFVYYNSLVVVYTFGMEVLSF